MNKITNAKFRKELEAIRGKKGYTFTDETGRVWTGEMACAKHFGMSRAEYRAKLKELRAELCAEHSKAVKKPEKKAAPKKPPITDVTIRGRVIPCEGDHNGRCYIELPDGYRLIFDNNGYVGRYEP